MKKLFLTLTAVLIIAGLALTACTTPQAATPTATEVAATDAAVTEAAATEVAAVTEAAAAVPLENKTAVLLVPVYSGYFKMIADSAAAPLQEMGFSVEILGADDNTQTMVKQIQNYTVKKVGLMYIFPAGDASAFHDVVKDAHDAGIKVVVSHNSTGEGTADTIIQADEFLMGTMDSAMVSKWVDATYPDAAPGTVKVLVLESSLIPDMIKRCAGMKLVGEKFLRKVDMTNARYVKTEGTDKVYYMENGEKVEVTEPTGGLILDADGNAMLNPFYNPKVTIVEFNDRSVMANAPAQKAMDVFVAADNGANKDFAAVMAYSGDAAIGASEKIIAMHDAGTITTDLSKIGVFGSDDTQDNITYLLKAKDGTSILRGVQTAGNIVGTIIKTVTAIAKGETVPAVQWEPLGYMTANADYSDVVREYYNNELPATAEFFKP